MLHATKEQVQTILANGLTNFVNVTGDQSYLELVIVALRDVKEVFFENIRADDTCMFAFPSMVILPEIRVECFVAVLNDRVIIVWRKGLFMKKTVSRIIPKHTIKQATWAVVNRPGVTHRGGATLLNIVADDTIDIAMPRDKPVVADMIVAAIYGRMRVL